MRHFMTAMVTFGIILAVSPAARAADTACPPDPSPGSTVNGNLVVPDNQRCNLFDVTVTGNVHVGTGATLGVSAAAVDGNIQADNCAFVFLLANKPSQISVGGNLRIQHCTELGGYENVESSITISGNFECHDNSSPCSARGGSVRGNVQITGNSGGSSLVLDNTVGGNVQVNDNSGGGAVLDHNSVGGNVQVNDNSGGTSVVRGNEIGGNLQCQGNTAVTDEFRPNTVAGHKQGQCAGL